MKIDKIFTQKQEVYVVSEHKVFRLGRTYRSMISMRSGKPFLVEETSLREMKNFIM